MHFLEVIAYITVGWGVGIATLLAVVWWEHK
jgi:hypothetical protein